jgi:outer membrane receptor protein involved in Fe transport
VQIFGIHEGNKDLKSITAKSYGFGTVWSPTADFSVKADYYHIKIGNEVQLQDINTLLRQESACRLGELDPASPTCIAALSQVIRSAADSPNPYAIQQVTVFPINIANESVSGIIASLDYKLATDAVGTFNFNTSYNVTLTHKQQQYPTDPVIDYLRNPFYSTDFKTIVAASVSWQIDKWTTTLRGTRYGQTPNYIAYTNTTGYDTPGAGKVPAWKLYNGSVNYSLNDDMNVSFIVNNIRNSKPPKDPTWTTSAYYNYNVFNPFGRELWLEFDWRFGRTKS